jgi:hypothetical protein
MQTPALVSILLAVKNGEHLRMTAVFVADLGSAERG